MYSLKYEYIHRKMCILCTSVCISTLYIVTSWTPFLFRNLQNISHKNILDEQYRPCCKQCSCAADCHVTNRCCPDATRDYSTNTDIVECVSLSDFLNRRRLYTFTYPRNHSESVKYRIIDRCPETYTNAIIKDNCTNPHDLQGYIIVSDIADGNHFANVHCALCHGVKETVHWDLYVDQCTDLLASHFRTFDESDAFVFHNCVLIAVPPSNVVVEISRCGEQERPIVNTCNTTKLWDEYDQDIEAGCHNTSNEDQSTHILQTHSMEGRMLLFVNPFCYQCNNPKNITTNEYSGLCKIDDVNSKRSLDLLSRLTIFDRENGIDHAYTCNSNEIFDSLEVIHITTCRQYFILNM